MTRLATGGSPCLAVAWTHFQPRTAGLGAALHGQARHIDGAWPPRHLALLPLRYATNAVRMWRELRRLRPQVLVAVSPPVMAPLVGWVWCLLHGCQFVVDCHTGVFYSGKWRWTLSIHRLLFRRAQAVLVHAEEDASLVRGGRVSAIVLPDDLPEPNQAALAERRGEGPRVVVAGSFDRDEPVAAALAAAALLPDVELRFTGDPAKLPASAWSGAPRNALFTGYLPYREFLGELMAADVVAVFTTEEHAMNRAAFEAIALGRPLVVSDVAGLRRRFGPAALCCANQPAAMADTIRRALHEQTALAGRSRALQAGLHLQRERALAQLQAILQASDRPSPTAAGASSAP